MKNLSFFAKAKGTQGKGGSGIIRGKQMAEYLHAKLNPMDDYDDDICIYVKQKPPENYPKYSYLDVIDGIERKKWLRKHPKVGAIATSKNGQEYLAKKLKRNDIILIPQHHCNYERIIRNRKEVKVAGVIGRPGSIECSCEELREKLGARGVEFKMQTYYKNRQDVVDFYKTIDIQIIWRKKVWPLKNSLKIVNAASFGIPTVAFPEKSYDDMQGYYLKARTLQELVEGVGRLKDRGWDASHLIKKAEEYHISNIAKLYRKLQTPEKKKEKKSVCFVGTIPPGKWYQEATINGVRMIRRRRSDTSKGRWKFFIEPLLPFKGEGRIVTDLGCNAGFYSRKLIDFGFKATGVEKDPMFIAHARYWEKNDPKGIRIIEGDLVDYDIPASQIVLLANVHYWLTPEEINKLVKKLKERALYVIVIGRHRERNGTVIRGDRKIGNIVSPSGIDALKNIFKGWEIKQTIYGKDKNYKHYSVLFKNPALVEKDIGEITLWPPFMKYTGFLPAFNKLIDLVLTETKFDPFEIDYFKYLKRRRFAEKLQRIKEHGNLIHSIIKEGIKEPLTIGRVVDGKYEQNSLWHGDHRLAIEKKIGIKKVICKIHGEVKAKKDYIASRKKAHWQEREKDTDWSRLVMVDVEKIWSLQPKVKNNRFVPAFNKLIDIVISRKPVDLFETDYFKYLKKRGFSDKKNLITRHTQLIGSVLKNGVKKPLIVGRIVHGEWHKNRLADGDHRLIIARKIGIKKLLCKVVL